MLRTDNFEARVANRNTNTWQQELQPEAQRWNIGHNEVMDQRLTLDENRVIRMD